jgi:hypothetical protein
VTTKGEGEQVMVTTEKGGVFYGCFVSEKDRKVTLRFARNCIYWPEEQKGFLGLASDGPKKGSRVGPAVEELIIFLVTSISRVSPQAIKRWEMAPWE